MRTLISFLVFCLCPSLWAQQYATILYRQSELPRAVPVTEIDSVVVRDVAEVEEVQPGEYKRTRIQEKDILTH